MTKDKLSTPCLHTSPKVGEESKYSRPEDRTWMCMGCEQSVVLQDGKWIDAPQYSWWGRLWKNFLKKKMKANSGFVRVKFEILVG